ncbi:peptidoglycan D,D-transpeptidase FtsI family protein [Streptacidiphilus fuscans]|uniref:Penicillin-binding protein 2 n=1 Tax=Streptacidiphilus fuscans TaxID=2789292 RepID=A0A931B0R7_9ACTN|nr:penicillin-binding protein 2 [Streptacidiphilus fuscans]MBF9068201.1 penicillin-binding protein 2 [Streptacidiphilus fuscans]
MNKPIRRVSVFCLLLVLALMIRANWVQGLDASALNANVHNKRTIIEEYSYPRGDIIVGGQPITKNLLVNGNYYKYRRAYVNGPMYAPVTGFDSQAYGSNLLENVENPILSGTDSRLFIGNTLDMLTGKQKQGGDVVTTIDPKVQQAAWNGLQGKTGAAVALDPTTGAILGLVSVPSYDPTSIAGVTSDFAKNWTNLQNDPNQPMLNRALRQTYPPGSTFKLVTAAAALETGQITNIDASTDSPNPYMLPGTTTPLPNEAGDTGCTNASLNTALALSCNTVFGKLGAEIGPSRMLQEAQKFGFNNSNLTIPVGVSGSNFDSNMNQAQTALSSIGQYDTRATPLQMAMVSAAIANNGSLMQPYLVSEERAANNSVVSQWQPKQLSQATTPDVAQQVQNMMINVVQNGTGTTAQIPGVTVGGKTGTAQHGMNNSDNPYAWFVSWAKGSNGKEIAVAVVVENSDTQRGDISGMMLGGPIAKAMMQAYVQ